MEKWTIEKMVKFWRQWEIHAGEPFMDCFVNDNIYNMGIVIGYFCGKVPELGKYILETSDYTIPWLYIMDSISKDGSDEYIPGIDELVEEFYKVADKNGVFNKENYNKTVYIWCSLIHDIDIYYTRFIEWIKDNKCEDIIQKLSE